MRLAVFVVGALLCALVTFNVGFVRGLVAWAILAVWTFLFWVERD